MGMDTLLLGSFILRLLNMYLHGLFGKDDRGVMVRVYVDQHVRIHGHCGRSRLEYIGNSGCQRESDQNRSSSKSLLHNPRVTRY
jgi:hypothetical protein